jgi:uncharacterized protein
MELENPQLNPTVEKAPESQPMSEQPIAKPGVWPAWPTIGFSAVIFAIYMFIQSMVVIVYFIFYMANQVAANTYLDPFTMVTDLISNGLLLSLATILSAIAGAGAIILFIKIRKGISISEYLGLKSFAKKNILIIIGIAIILIAASAVIDRFFPQSQNANFTVDAFNTAIWPPLLGIAVVIFAPLFEEGFFRGFLFVGLVKSKLGAIGTILLTSICWAALHIQYDLYGILTIFVLGIILGIVRLKTGSLWTVLILHGLWNLTAIIATVLYVNGVGT